MLFHCLIAVHNQLQQTTIWTGRDKLRKKRFPVVFLATLCLLAVAMPSAWARRKKHHGVSPNDPTYMVYQLLNNSYGGKLSNFYLLANVYTDPQSPKTQLQRVIRVNYNKNLYFGRFQIDVRSVDKMTSAQLKTYSVKQIFKFGQSDDARFEKLNPGPLGGTGDLYLTPSSDGPLASAPITDQTRQEYDMLITKYILPALKKH